MHYIITPTVGSTYYLQETILGVRQAFGSIPYRHLLISKFPLPSDVRELVGPSFMEARDAGTGLYPALNASLKILKESGNCNSFSYINDDDGVFPQYAAMLAYHIECGADVTYGGVEYVDAGGRFCGHVSISRKPEDLLPLFQSGCPGLTQQGAIFSARFLRDGLYFNEDLRLASDSMLFVDALSLGFRFSHFRDTVAYYRRRPGQLSGDVHRAVQETEILITRAKQRDTGRLNRALAMLRFRTVNIMRILVRWYISGAGTSRHFFDQT